MTIAGVVFVSVLLVIACVLLWGILKSEGTESRASHLFEQGNPEAGERQPEQDGYQRRFHEKAVAEAARGPRPPRESSPPQSANPPAARDKRREISELLPQPRPSRKFTPPQQAKPEITPVKRRELSELLPHQFVVLDLETTGLSPIVNEIIEIGALKVTLEMNEHSAFQTFVKPTKRVPNNITRMTGITQAMVDEHGIELQSALRQLMEFIGELPLVTYNAQFDMAFLWAAAKRCHLELPNQYSCALKRARRAFPDFPSHKLSYMAERLSLPDGNQHRAVGDCERAAHVFLLSTVELNQKVRWSAPTTLNS